MSDKILSDSIDLMVTKQDFIELMNDNAKLLAEMERLTWERNRAEADAERFREALEQIIQTAWKKGGRFCHPEGCGSPGIAADALKEKDHD